MQDQVTSLCEKCVAACYINIDASCVTFGEQEEDWSDGDYDEEPKQLKLTSSAGIKSVNDGKYNIIYMHPETVFMKDIGTVLRNSAFRCRVCCTVIDEVHMVSEWGSEFRKTFDRLGEFTCLFPNILSCGT